MNAEQYRTLVRKLEAINEAPEDDQAAAAAASDAGNLPPPTAQPAQQGATNIDAYKPTDGLKDVPGNSKSQAIQNAIKMGLKPGAKFRWCMKYKVQGGTKQHTDPKKDTLPYTRTPQSQYDVPNTPSGRLQAGLGNLIETQLSEALTKLRHRLNEAEGLAYGQPDPDNPGFMWVPADGTSPFGTEGNPKPMVHTGTGGYVNAKMVPVSQPVPRPIVAPADEPAPAPLSPADTGDTSSSTVAHVDANTPTTCTIEDQARIKYMPTFNQAYAAAKKAGCPEFIWCQVLKVPSQQHADPIGPDNSGANDIDSIVNGNPGRTDPAATTAYFNSRK